MAGVKIIDGDMIEALIADEAAFVRAAYKLFDQLDTDGDGHVDRNQLVAGFDDIFCSASDDVYDGADDCDKRRPVERSEVLDVFCSHGSRRGYISRGDFVRGYARLMNACAHGLGGAPVFVALHGEPFSLFGPVFDHAGGQSSAALD